MSDFKTKMHQIRFRLGLRPRPHSGSLQRSLRPPSWISGALLLRGGEGRGKGKERDGNGMDGKWTERKGLKPPQSKFSGYVAVFKQ